MREIDVTVALPTLQSPAVVISPTGIFADGHVLLTETPIIINWTRDTGVGGDAGVRIDGDKL